MFVCMYGNKRKTPFKSYYLVKRTNMNFKKRFCYRRKPLEWINTTKIIYCIYTCHWLLQTPQKNESQRGTSESDILKDIVLWIKSDISLKDRVHIQICSIFVMCLIISISLKKEGSLLLSLIIPVNSYVVVSLKSKIFKY